MSSDLFGDPLQRPETLFRGKGMYFKINCFIFLIIF